MWGHDDTASWTSTDSTNSGSMGVSTETVEIAEGRRDGEQLANKGRYVGIHSPQFMSQRQNGKRYLWAQGPGEGRASESHIPIRDLLQVLSVMHLSCPSSLWTVLPHERRVQGPLPCTLPGTQTPHPIVLASNPCNLALAFGKALIFSILWKLNPFPPGCFLTVAPHLLLGGG